MEITAIGLLLDERREVLEKALKNDLIDSFEIEELDEKDSRKDVFICFSNPVESKYIHEVISDILGNAKTKKTTEE